MSALRMRSSPLVVPAVADGDSDAHVTGDVSAFEDVGPVDRGQHAPRHADGSLRVSAADEHRELVAAEPGGEILGANRAGEPLRERREQLVAGAVAPGVVDGLEAVEVEIEDGRRCPDGELLLDRLDQVDPVRQTGETVVIRLVAELLLELRHLGERVLEPAVLEQDARVAGEGAEELDVGLGEGADVAEALAHDEQAERPGLAAQRGHDRVLEPARAKERVECLCRAAPRKQHRRSGGRDLRECGSVLRREPVLRVHEQLALGSADAAQRTFAVGGGQEEDLGVLGPKQPARGDQQLPHCETELRCALRRAHRLVEELEVLSLLALLHVAPEGRDGRQDRNDEQEHGGGASLQERHDREAERRGREGAERRRHERSAELRRLEALLGDRDHGRDEEDADDVRDRTRDEHVDPQMRRRVGRRGQRAEDDQGDAAAERQLRKVEGELRELAQLAPAPVDDEGEERSDELSDQQRRRRGEEQAESQPDFCQRQRVRLLTELQVDDQNFREIERERQPVPGKNRPVPEPRLVEAADPERPHEHAGDRQHAVEGPDTAWRAKGLTRADAERAQELARRRGARR